MREVTVEQGSSTVKFIRQPRKGRKVGKVSVIVFNHEIPNNNVEEFRKALQDDWKNTVRRFGLDVSVE